MVWIQYTIVWIKNKKLSEDIIKHLKGLQQLK
jgi:hypothetical protein